MGRQDQRKEQKKKKKKKTIWKLTKQLVASKQLHNKGSLSHAAHSEHYSGCNLFYFYLFHIKFCSIATLHIDKSRMKETPRGEFLPKWSLLLDAKCFCSECFCSESSSAIHESSTCILAAWLDAVLLACILQELILSRKCRMQLFCGQCP